MPAEKYEERKKQVEGVAAPIFSSLSGAGAAAAAAGGDMGGMGGMGDMGGGRWGLKHNTLLWCRSLASMAACGWHRSG